MNILLGVDAVRTGVGPTNAEQLLCRLRFPSAEVDVVNVMMPIIYDDWGIEIGTDIAVLIQEQQSVERESRNAVSHVAARIRESMVNAGIGGFVKSDLTKCLSVAEALLAKAIAVRANLIVVDGPHHGPVGAFLTGSVARALVVNSQSHSLLLAKKPEGCTLSQNSPVRAVFATDHSPYANACLQELLRMAPRGISHLTVMTAFPESKLAATGPLLDNLSVNPAVAMRDCLEQRNASVMDQLAPVLEKNAASSASIVSGLPIHDAIASAMKLAGAELLILGARGHGFVQRVTLGSVSFHQAMTAPYSVLILRTDTK